MKKISVAKYSINSSKLSPVWNGYKIGFIADYHDNDYGIDDEAVFKKLNELKPDIIIIGGDMIVAKPGKNNDRAYSFLKRLANDYTVYYANGNHEYRAKIYPQTYGDMYDEFLKNIKETSIVHLINESAIVSKGDKHIVIKGLEIDAKYYSRFEKQKMEKEYIEELVGKCSDDFEILIAHNPKYFDSYAEYGADLVLSGHVHGGLVRLPLLGGVVSPDVKFFPKYDYGKFTKNDKNMILTGGLGAHTIKIRLFNPPEIVCITLNGGSNGDIS